MANTITSQTLNDGPHNTVVHFFISGDGSGEESATTIVTAANLSGAPSAVKVVKIQSQLSGFDAALLWHATANVPFLEVNSGWNEMDYREVGGLFNNSGAGKTGNIKITTVGLGANDKGSITLWMVKK